MKFEFVRKVVDKLEQKPFLSWLLREIRAIPSGLGAAMAVVGIMAVCWLYWFIKYRPEEERADQLMQATARAAEEVYCQKAGYGAPLWKLGADSIKVFYCVDKNGQMFPFVPPKCNTQGGEGDGHSRECGTLSISESPSTTK